MKPLGKIKTLSPSKTLFWVIFTPPLILSLAAVCFLFFSRISDLEQQLDNKALIISDLLVSTSQVALASNNPPISPQLLQNALSYGDVHNIEIFNSKYHIVAETGAAPYLPSPTLTEQAVSEQKDDAIIRITPIYHVIPTEVDEISGQPDFVNLRTPNHLIGWVKVEISKDKLAIQTYQLISLLALFFAFFNSITAYIAWQASHYLARPSEIITGAINNLVKGQFASAKSLKLSPQFSLLEKGIRDLAERLESHKEELNAGIEQSTEDLRSNLDSLEEKSAQLHIANKEAMESNRLKSQFLANISHEVRTPLNAILGYTKILQKNLVDDQQKIYIDTIEQSTNSLLAIIGDILDFSKIEAGKLSLDHGDVNLRELVDDVYQILSASLLTSEKQIDLVPEFSEDVPQWVTGDAVRIRQILNNLIGNAIKFTHKGSIRTKVTVVKQTSEQLLLSFKVIDTGIGIPENKLNRLFKPFSQVDNSTTRQFGGTGLGLVITKKLVEQMDGNIDVYSDQKNGSTFYFTLNLQPSEKTDQTPEKLNKQFILLEPSHLYRLYLTHYLKSIGVQCTACSTLEQVIAKLGQQDTDIDGLLISITPSDKSANEAHELISYASLQFQIPSILMIQPPGQTTHYPALKAICSSTLLKPISHKHLYHALKTISLPIQIDAATPLLPKQQPNIAEAQTPIESQPAIDSQAQQTEPEQQTHGLKVLAVDDTPINLQLMSHWLTPNGIEVTLAYSGQQAINIAKENTFDLILMDIQMPEMDGIETTKQLRTLEAYQDIPIIAVTAHALGIEREKMLLSGINAYLTKPIDENILLNTIVKWCTKKGNYQEQLNSEIANAFDVNKALEIVNQKTDIAKEMFDMLADTLEDEKRLIKHHFEHQDLEKLIHVVHRIHGASKYTGTINMTRHAGYLETHLKELGFEEVEGVLEDFLDAIDQVINARPWIKWPQE